MRRLGLWVALSLSAGSARAEIWAHERAVIGTTGGYFGNSVEAGGGFWDSYEASGRVKSFRCGEAFPGTAVEYSAAVRRYLYHATVTGRLGTKPPNAQRAAYHLASGEVVMTFYGLTLAPERPELAFKVWEDSGIASRPESLDKTWVTALGSAYTNTNHHLEFPNGILVVVQNSTRFMLKETWRGKTSAGLQFGLTRYNKVLLNNAPVFYLDNIDYPGGAFAVRGWPNNHVGGELEQKLGDWTLEAAGTRLNLLGNKTEFLYGLTARWAPSGLLRAFLGGYVRRRRGEESRQAVSLGVSLMLK